MDRLAIEALSVFGLPPVQFVDLAAELGCSDITVLLADLTSLPLGYPPFSLKDDPALRRDLLAALEHRGVGISLGDGFLVLPGADMRSFGDDLDVLAELGVPRINVVSLEADRGRSFDQFAALAELASQRGIQTVVEPVPGLTVGDLPTAVAAVKQIGRPDVRLLIDTMHLVRSGSGADDLAALDPCHIGYAQLNDATVKPHNDNYAEEAMYERMCPGQGELPLHDIVAALPGDIVIGLEVPQRSLALAGVQPVDRLRPCVEAARAILSSVNRHDRREH
jgi:sugar phosphate isomerase/epimerase